MNPSERIWELSGQDLDMKKTLTAIIKYLDEEQERQNLLMPKEICFKCGELGNKHIPDGQCPQQPNKPPKSLHLCTKVDKPEQSEPKQFSGYMTETPKFKEGEVDLLPCPFCGGEDISIDRKYINPISKDSHPDEIFVGCVSCGIGYHGDCEQSQIDDWNARKHPPCPCRKLPDIGIVYSEWLKNTKNGYLLDFFKYLNDNFSLPPVPSVEWPEKKPEMPKEFKGLGYNSGWNACHDAFMKVIKARLEGKCNSMT